MNAPITGYRLSHLRVAPVGPGAGLVTYIADIEIPDGHHPDHAQLAVGEVWMKKGDEWMCRYYQGTLMK